jgi:hypothetical protein
VETVTVIAGRVSAWRVQAMRKRNLFQAELGMTTDLCSMLITTNMFVFLSHWILLMTSEKSRALRPQKKMSKNVTAPWNGRQRGRVLPLPSSR